MWSAGGAAAVRRTALLRPRPPLGLAPASASSAAARALGGGRLLLQPGGARRHQGGGVYSFPPSAHYDLVCCVSIGSGLVERVEGGGTRVRML